MKTIYKFKVEPSEKFEVMIPRYGTILSVQTQFNEPQFWVLVNNQAPLEKRTFGTFGTGHKIPDNIILQYHGSFPLDRGLLIFHLFEYV